MTNQHDSRRTDPIYILAGITLLLFVIHAYRLVHVEGTSIITIIFRDIGPLVASLIIAGAVYWLHQKIYKHDRSSGYAVGTYSA